MWKCPAGRQPEFKVNCNFYGKVLRNMNYIVHTLSDNMGSILLSSHQVEFKECKKEVNMEECFTVVYFLVFPLFSLTTFDFLGP